MHTALEQPQEPVQVQEPVQPKEPKQLNDCDNVQDAKQPINWEELEGYNHAYDPSIFDMLNPSDNIYASVEHEDPIKTTEPERQAPSASTAVVNNSDQLEASVMPNESMESEHETKPVSAGEIESKDNAAWAANGPVAEEDFSSNPFTRHGSTPTEPSAPFFKLFGSFIDEGRKRVTDFCYDAGAVLVGSTVLPSIAANLAASLFTGKHRTLHASTAPASDTPSDPKSRKFPTSTERELLERVAAKYPGHNHRENKQQFRAPSGGNIDRASTDALPPQLEQLRDQAIQPASGLQSAVQHTAAVKEKKIKPVKQTDEKDQTSLDNGHRPAAAEIQVNSADETIEHHTDSEQFIATIEDQSTLMKQADGRDRPLPDDENRPAGANTKVESDSDTIDDQLDADTEAVLKRLFDQVEIKDLEKRAAKRAARQATRERMTAILSESLIA